MDIGLKSRTRCGNRVVGFEENEGNLIVGPIWCRLKSHDVTLLVLSDLLKNAGAVLVPKEYAESVYYFCQAGSNLLSFPKRRTMKFQFDRVQDD
ncbi:hypothetical protein ACS0TY_019173 [Phlomoides rotata]